MSGKDLLDAIECCRANNRCDHCPLQEEICDRLEIEMVYMPAELVDRIEAKIAEKMTL